jgi:UDP-N-acetylmuramate dehydrogenase
VRPEHGWLGEQAGVGAGHPLAKHTSFNIGGPAEFFAEVSTLARMEELVEACEAHGTPWMVLGAGTNLLISDAGIEGLVIRCTAREHRIQGDRVCAAAGLKMMRLARIAADADLVGFEFAIGVPGTVGGAVYQNAGCWGKEIKDVLVGVEGYVPGGGRQSWPASSLDLGYRTSSFREGSHRGHLIESATIRLRPGDGQAARREMARLTRERNRTQPIRTLNCGSVFKNPPGDSAGRLVEAAGLKGAAEGAARFSPQHANFIENTGGASAADVARLIERARAKIHKRFGVELETEVEKVGRW